MSSKEINEIVVDSLPIDIEPGATYIINQPNPNYLTHSFFKYPCKFIPEIPKWAISKYITKPNAIVFDPFTGSGTTLLEGILAGYNSFGTEIDEVAKLITKVKTTQFSSEQIITTQSTISNIEKNYDSVVDPKYVAKINNLDHWFTNANIKKLAYLRSQIESVIDPDIKDFLNLCLAAIVKKASNADSISPKPYVSTKIVKDTTDAITEFGIVSKRYLSLLKEFSELTNIAHARFVDHDALDIRMNARVDIAITSPPYINAFDYVRTLRLENLWLSLTNEQDLLKKKKDYVGTEYIKVQAEQNDLSILDDSTLLKEYFNKLLNVDKKRALVVKKFFESMKKNLIEVHRILENRSVYVVVIGNSSIRQIEIESWHVIEQIAEKVGFVLELDFDYMIRNPYIRIPRGNKGGKISKDHVIVLRKN